MFVNIVDNFYLPSLLIYAYGYCRAKWRSAVYCALFIVAPMFAHALHNSFTIVRL